jgi:outer membrane receptor protein involved in Fe transport
MMSVAMAITQPAIAADSRSFDVPAGPLGNAIVILGRQGEITIGVSDALLANVRVRGVKGRMTAREAISRAIGGSGLSYVEIDPHTFHIIRRPSATRAPVPSPNPVPTAALPEADIIVTASKRGTGLDDFPATVSILRPGERSMGRNDASGTDAIVDALPSLVSTHLGPGRNKLIIRGVSDSSFTGPTQAIVGQYLGDIRLNYNAPDPDLNLYDMERIEVLEGPQGTLYGAGSLGGIVRLVPYAPDLANIAGSASAGALATHGGARGSDFAAMANIPFLADAIGLRAVGYRSIDGGYIDDAGRGLRNVNRSRAEGGRATLRIAPGSGWTVDFGGTFQNINNADSQYAERGLPRFTRSSVIAQPFDNDYLLGQLVVAKDWKNLSLISATGAVRHDVVARYDATARPAGIPTAFDQKNHIRLYSNENRLSRKSSDGTGWLIGTSLISDSERLTRTLGPPGSPARIAGLRNSVTEAALYGEVSIPVLRGVTVTGGGRIAYNRLSGELLDLTVPEDAEPRRTEVELLPSFAMAWRPRTDLTIFARYQEGFRPGGLSVAAGGSGLVSQRYEGDGITAIETGLRFRDPQRDRFSATLTLSYSRWKNIQADLVDTGGLPFTANIGDGRVLGLEANMAWSLMPGLTAEAGLFLNDSTLTQPAPGFEDSDRARLPNIADLGNRLAISYRTRLAGAMTLAVDASVRFFGRSRLGVGPVLDIGQGDYVETALGARLGTERAGVSLDLTNLLDVAANRFALGNPFGVMDGRQITPQRPRTIRIGIDGRF